MPGVLIIETMAQVGACMFPQKKAGYLSSVNKVKFLTFVRPGDQLIIEVGFIDQVSHYFKVEAKAYVDESLAAKAEITYYLEE